ncbi:hypothetical protein TNCV_3917641 [Trichonephila clavipes]|nr:hypothetical protein TNCV_3917641 [Trichonephila clavipes]
MRELIAASNSSNDVVSNLTKLKLDDRERRRQGRLFPEGWEKKVNHDEMTDLIKKTPTTKRGGRAYPKARNALSKQSAGRARGRTQEGKRDGRRQDRGDLLPMREMAREILPQNFSDRKSMCFLNVKRLSMCRSRYFTTETHWMLSSKSLDTLREDCGIIRKQASTDGGVLWKIMCVDVVQVRRKDRSLRDPRDARSRVRI